MTTTPKTRSPEQIVAEALNHFVVSIGGLDNADSWREEASAVIHALRAAGLLVGAPPETCVEVPADAKRIRLTGTLAAPKVEVLERHTREDSPTNEQPWNDPGDPNSPTYDSPWEKASALIATIRAAQLDLLHNRPVEDVQDEITLSINRLDELCATMLAADVASSASPVEVDDDERDSPTGAPNEAEAEGEEHEGHGATVAGTPQEPSAHVVMRGHDTDCARGLCLGACSHLMWYCDRCSCEGGWGAPRDMLEQWAAKHVCPTPPAPNIADEAVQKLSALGLDDTAIRECLEQATTLAAAGASTELVQVVVKIAATARITSEDLHLMERRGIQVRLPKGPAPSVDRERRRVEVSNRIADVVFDEVKRVWPDLHPVLGLRYGIADAVIAAFPTLAAPVSVEIDEAELAEVIERYTGEWVNFGKRGLGKMRSEGIARAVREYLESQRGEGQ